MVVEKRQKGKEKLEKNFDDWECQQKLSST